MLEIAKKILYTHLFWNILARDRGLTRHKIARDERSEAIRMTDGRKVLRRNEDPVKVDGNLHDRHLHLQV